MRKKQKNSHFYRQIGVSIDNNIFTCLYFGEQGEPIFFTIELNNTDYFLSSLKAKLENFKNLNKYQWITSVSPHYIWQKSVVFPIDLSLEDKRQQALFLLESDLPVPFTQVWFDMYEKQFAQSTRIDLFAIQQDIAKNYIEKFYPIKINVLDNKIYSIKRAFNYLISKDVFESGVLEKSIFIYYQKGRAIIITETIQQLIVLEKTLQKNTALFTIVEQFCQQYNLLEEAIFLFQDLENPIKELLPKNWHLVETSLPFIPLGNVLWNGAEKGCYEY